MKDIRFVIHPLHDRQVRDHQQAVWLLLGAVALVFSIAVANVANLSLARAAARRQELSVRAALGASKARLARQALTESLALATLSGAAGLLLAAGLLRLFRTIAPEGILRLDEAVIDWRIAGFALLVTLASSILVGLAPALRTPAPGSLTGLRVTGPHLKGRRPDRLRPALVILQVALSITLLCGAALFLESLRNMANAPLGMETASLFSVYAKLPEARYPHPPQRAAFWRTLTERLTSAPGVATIGIADSLPPQGRAQGRVASSISVPGRPKPAGAAGTVVVRHVSASYFRMLGIPVREGRLFADKEDGAIVLSARMAARMFPGESAVDSICSSPGQHLLLRADSRALPFVREAFAALDPRLTVEVETLDERVRQMRARPRFQTMLLTGFAIAGLALAAIGLYGVIALLTVQRTGEIAVRLALGATTAQIRTMVLRQAGTWTAAGIALGLCGVAASGRLLQGLLYGVQATAPLPLAFAIAALTVAALLAAWIPARRAASIEPVQALREL